MKQLVFLVMCLTCLGFTSFSEAQDSISYLKGKNSIIVEPDSKQQRKVQLPESEWVKLLAFVDSCKQNKAHDQQEIQLLVKLKGENEKLITLNKQHIALLDEAQMNRQNIEETLTKIIGEKEIQLVEKDAELKKEKRYSRYKSEMGIPAAVIMSVVLSALLMRH